MPFACIKGSSLIVKNLVKQTFIKHQSLQSNKITSSLGTLNNKFQRISFRMLTQEPSQSHIPKKVFVQSNLSGEYIMISFNVNHNDKCKQFNLTRKPQDTLLSTLDRIKLNIEKINKKVIKSKKKKINNQELISENNLDGDGQAIQFSLNGKAVDAASTKNIDAWVDGAALTILGETYEISTNNPTVESINLPSNIMQKFVCMPLVKLINCHINNCKFGWFRKISKQERDKLGQEECFDKSTITCDDITNTFWLKISDNIAYCTTEEDVAHHLKVSCQPSDGKKWGLTSYSISDTPVQIGPKECPFEKRHLLTEKPSSGANEFRVVSYNILADLYADSDYSRAHLFAHCPGFAIDLDYRRQLLLKELIGYNADIYCMQEVDKKEFDRIYGSFFEIVGGCSGVFNTKGGQVAEGPATFYRNTKLELINTHRTVLSELIDKQNKSCDIEETQDQKQDKEPEPHFILRPRDSTIAQECLSKFDSIRQAILSNKELSMRFLDRHTVLQTTLLKVKESVNNYILVGNTHLYFAPDADHVRLLQGSICIKYLEFIKNYYEQRLYKESDEKPIISVIFCGDMNSTPDCGLYKLAHHGFVGPDLPDWSSNKEEAIKGLEISTSLRFKSAYQDIEYTNYTPLFNGCLDYIYYDVENSTCESVVPLPDHNEVTAIGGIPSEVFPSDHLALVANLKIIIKN